MGPGEMEEVCSAPDDIPREAHGRVIARKCVVKSDAGRIIRRVLIEDRLACGFCSDARKPNDARERCSARERCWVRRQIYRSAERIYDVCSCAVRDGEFGTADRN